MKREGRQAGEVGGRGGALRWFIAVMTVWLSIAGVAAGATPVRLVGADLEAKPANVVSLAGTALTYFDAQRVLRTEPVATFMQVLLTAPTGNAGGAGAAREAGEAGAMVVELVDGQRLCGHWAGATADGAAIVWRHRRLGDVNVMLDQVRWLGRGETAPTAGDAERDALVLVNGDVVEGFVDHVDETGVVLKPAGGGAALALARERIRAMRLVNARLTAGDGGEGYGLWLRDGSRVRVTDVRWSEETIEAAMGSGDEARRVELPASEVERMDVPSSAGRLVEWGKLPMRVTAGGVVMGVSMPPTAGDGVVRLHAPVTVEYELPAGAARLRAVLSLGAAPAGSRAELADLGVRLRVDGVELWRGRLSGGEGGAREAVVNAALSGRRLVVEVDAGANGPVLDRLEIREAVILARPAGGRGP